MKKNSSKAIRLTTLAGIADAEIQGDSIVGYWKPKRELAYLTNTRGLVEHFVNLHSDEQILRFVRKYGPLERPLEPADLTFRQSLASWREYQGFVRARLWSSALGYKPAMHEGDRIEFDAAGRVSGIVLCSLKRFLEFQIFTAPRALRRICANPDCGNYFIAQRTDKRVCNLAACGTWAQRQFKRAWWAENGEKWRARRAKHRKRHPSKSTPRQSVAAPSSDMALTQNAQRKHLSRRVSVNY